MINGKIESYLMNCPFCEAQFEYRATISTYLRHTHECSSCGEILTFDIVIPRPQVTFYDDRFDGGAA